MASFKPFCWGPPLKWYPFLDSGLVEGPAGYRLHPNPKLGARRKVKWEKIENSLPNQFYFLFWLFEIFFFGNLGFFQMFLFND